MRIIRYASDKAKQRTRVIRHKRVRY